MSIKVVSGSNVVKKVVVSGSNVVKKIVVGTPVRRVTSGAFSINNLGGVDISTAEDGALLVYNATNETFEALVQIDNNNTNINGGNF